MLKLIRLQQRFFYRSELCCQSDDIDLSPYHFLWNDNVVFVKKNDVTVASTDGRNFLQVEERRYIKRSLFSNELFFGEQSIVIDMLPSGIKQTLLLSIAHVLFDHKTYKIIHHEGYYMLFLTKVEISFSENSDLVQVLACLAFFWLHYELKRTRFG